MYNKNSPGFVAQVIDYTRDCYFRSRLRINKMYFDRDSGCETGRANGRSIVA